MQVTRCDQCKALSDEPGAGAWLTLDKGYGAPHLDLCSWECVAKYATSKIADAADRQRREQMGDAA